MSEAKADELGVIIAALEAENFRLAAGACLVEGGLIGDEHGHFHCSLKDTIAALTAKLAKAERDREQAVEAAWRDGFNCCRQCLREDEAACLTDDVEADAWADSETRSPTPEES